MVFRPYKASKLIPPLAGLWVFSGEASTDVSPAAGAVKKSALSPKVALFSNPLNSKPFVAAGAGAGAGAGSLKLRRSTDESIAVWSCAGLVEVPLARRSAMYSLIVSRNDSGGCSSFGNSMVDPKARDFENW